MFSKIMKTHTRVDLWKAFRRKEEMCGMPLKSEKTVKYKSRHWMTSPTE